MSQKNAWDHPVVVVVVERTGAEQLVPLMD
jgi:hypothetical protein